MTRDEALATINRVVPPMTKGMTKLAPRFNHAASLERRTTEDPAKFAQLLLARQVLDYEARLEMGDDAPWAFSDDPRSPHSRGTPQAEAAVAHWEKLKARHGGDR